MTKKFFHKVKLLLTGFIIFASANNGISQETIMGMLDSQSSDTITLPEVELDSARFFLTEDLSKVENTIKGSTYILIEGKVYKIPYRITSTTNVVLKGKSRYFRLTGLPLSQEFELQNYISQLFRYPREKLKDVIPANQWKNSSVYLRYFEPYDRNSSNRKDVETEVIENDVNEFEEFKSDAVDGSVPQNYVNFPFPETLDIEVDLRKTPGVVTILGLEFNFDKLDKSFQRLLLDYEKSSNIKKSTSEKK